MANLESFCKLYHSYFNKSIEKDKEIWYTFVNDADELILRNTLDTLEELFSTRKQGGFKVDPPTYPDVKREYWQLKSRDGNSDRKRFCHEGCAQCDGTGSVLIVIHKASKLPLDPQNPQPYAYGDLGYTNADCPHGFFAKRRDHRGFGPSSSMPLQKAHDFMMECDRMLNAGGVR